MVTFLNSSDFSFFVKKKQCQMVIKVCHMKKNTDLSTALLLHFYPQDTPLRRMLLRHSRQVCDKAMQIAEYPACSALHLDKELIREGAMLHDIGIFRCHAPGILCEGSEPYIKHGIIGAHLLREYGAAEGVELEPYARICERHTGSGLTRENILTQQLPLPAQDFLPETAEEKLICLADKFFSKSGDMCEKELSHIRRSMEKFGADSLERFDDMCRLFGVFSA